MIAARARHTVRTLVHRTAPPYVFRIEAIGGESSGTVIDRVTDTVMAGARIFDAWHAEYESRYRRGLPEA